MTAIAHLHEVERARAARFQELGGHNLAEIARTREFTTEENNQFDTIEREMRQWDARVDTLARQAETEERASSFAANLIDGNRHTPRASSEWRNLDSGERAALDPGESIRSHPVFERATAGNSRAESNYGSLGEMIRALATGGTGSAIVPTAWSANLIDLARSQSAVAMANATIVPMDAKTVTIGRQTGDPSAAFRAEGSVIGHRTRRSIASPSRRRPSVRSWWLPWSSGRMPRTRIRSSSERSPRKWARRSISSRSTEV